jgi:hypothetical protein
MEGLDERELFEEFIAVRQNAARVFVHGTRPLGLTIHIGPKTKAVGSARRLYEAMYQHLPKAVFDDLVIIIKRNHK